LNLLGKELVAMELAKKIKQLLTQAETNTIEMHWTEDNQHGEYSSVQNEIEDLTWVKNYIKSVESNQSQDEKIDKCKKNSEN
jgi:ribose 5-phosphate isomerase RpiB